MLGCNGLNNAIKNLVYLTLWKLNKYCMVYLKTFPRNLKTCVIFFLFTKYVSYIDDLTRPYNISSSPYSSWRKSTNKPFTRTRQKIDHFRGTYFSMKVTVATQATQMYHVRIVVKDDTFLGLFGAGTTTPP